MMARVGYKKAWIIPFWLDKMKNPFPEPYSIRQAFYEELHNIIKIVPIHILNGFGDKAQTKPLKTKWSLLFYHAFCSYLSDLVLSGQCSYEKINLIEDSGASQHIWQKMITPTEYSFEDAYVEYPIEIWVENNATYNSLKPLLINKATKQFHLNLISQKGFGKTQGIEQVKLYRAQDVKVILNLTDFDASGYYMPKDLQNRFNRIGLNIKVEHIGIFPHQIPLQKRGYSIKVNKKDKRYKRFLKAFPNDQLIQQGFGYEIQALNPSEIRDLTKQAIEDTIQRYNFQKTTKP